MINDKKVLGIIPARGGSKGVPGKNIRPLCGKPLLAWTIEAAIQSRYLDKLIVTSDDEIIIQTAIAFGADVPFVRPVHLAQDDTPGIAPVLHAINELPGYDYIVLLQPTSPLRNVQDIDTCIEKYNVSSAESVVSVTEQEKSPYWMFEIGVRSRLRPIMGKTNTSRRQDLKQTYTLNGAVYVSSVETLKKSETFLTESTEAYVMPKERSIDIDTITDFRICEMILAQKLHSGK